MSKALVSNREHLVTRIVRDSILDGPGCRYVVFLKGCHLRCPWCHNPETQDPRQQVVFYRSFCIQCGRCVEALGTGEEAVPVQIADPADPRYLACADVCPTRAIDRVAQAYAVDELLNDAAKYTTVYRETGGGVTLSGGDPLSAPDFTAAFLEAARGRGFHTAVDTSGTVPWRVIERLHPLVDLWLWDVKHLNAPSVHAERAAENLRRLAGLEASAWIRVPLIPGFNDSKEAWKGMVELIISVKSAVGAVCILPYHPYGKEKYEALGRPYSLTEGLEVGQAVLDEARETFASALPAIPVTVGRTITHG